MQKELLEYLNGKRNSVQTELVLGREKCRSSEMIFVGAPGYEKPIYCLFNSTKKVKGKFEIKESTKEESGEKIATLVKCTPKGTRQPSYVMAMLSSVEIINSLSFEAAGLLLKLFGCIEWNTGRLIRTRDKKPLTRGMMSKMFGIGKQRLKNVISELSKHDVLKYDRQSQAYYMNIKLFRKGGVSSEDKV